MMTLRRCADCRTSQQAAAAAEGGDGKGSQAQGHETRTGGVTRGGQGSGHRGGVRRVDSPLGGARVDGARPTVRPTRGSETSSPPPRGIGGAWRGRAAPSCPPEE
ncbi:hypothetical protein MTO96_006480 [Rhipicephalus appendiculatus]